MKMGNQDHLNQIILAILFSFCKFLHCYISKAVQKETD